MNLRSRVQKIEELVTGVDNPTLSCGRGVPIRLSEAQEFRGRQCSAHGSACWKRASAQYHAEAAALLEALQQERREGLPAGSLSANPGPPAPVLVEAARQLILNDGIEEYIEDN